MCHVVLMCYGTSCLTCSWVCQFTAEKIKVKAQCPQLCWPQTPQSPVAPAAGPESYYGSAWGGYGYGNPYAAAPPYNPYGPYGSYHWILRDERVRVALGESRCEAPSGDVGA
eukprot:g24264.t2